MSGLHVEIVLYFHKMFYPQAYNIFEAQSYLAHEFSRTMFNNVKNSPGFR